MGEREGIGKGERGRGRHGRRRKRRRRRKGGGERNEGREGGKIRRNSIDVHSAILEIFKFALLEITRKANKYYFNKTDVTTVCATRSRRAPFRDLQ